MKPSSVPSYFSFLTLILLSGCMSANVKWREGSHPANKDEWVRFKTTYYFRVVDTCMPPKPRVISNLRDQTLYQNPLNVREKSKGYILSDTLYRFNMTGKAHEWSSVKFEAGTLLASQIDPFGNTISSQNGQISYQSAAERAHESVEVAQAEKLKQLQEELDRVTDKKSALVDNQSEFAKKLKEELEKQQLTLQKKLTDYYENMFGSASTEHSERFQIAGAEYKVVIDENLFNIQEELTADEKLTLSHTKGFNKEQTLIVSGLEILNAVKVLQNKAQSSGAKADEEAEQTNTSNDYLSAINTLLNAEPLTEQSVCPAGLAKNHGYLILGPEGWRHFDPEQRLLLAMTSSEKPLISTMTELSNRMQQAHSAKPDSSPLKEEKQRILELELNYRRGNKDMSNQSGRDEVKESIENLINRFSSSATGQND